VIFAAITLCVASQRVFIVVVVVVYFVIGSVRKLLDTPSYEDLLLCTFLKLPSSFCIKKYTLNRAMLLLNLSLRTTFPFVRFEVFTAMKIQVVVSWVSKTQRQRYPLKC
jgi:hypothetical protein